MAIVVFTRRNVAALKSSLRTALPSIGSAHADEALAAGIGFKTHAAMLAALKAQGSAKLTVVLNEWMVSARLVELTGSEPDFSALSKACWEAKLPDAPEGRVRMGDWWRHVANEN